VEVHHDPDNALSDGPQSLTIEMFGRLMNELLPIAEAMGRSLLPDRAAGAGQLVFPEI
jgi:3-deoxy-7-phosphoheptulonate synthase